MVVLSVTLIRIGKASGLWTPRDKICVLMLVLTSSYVREVLAILFKRSVFWKCPPKNTDMEMQQNLYMYAMENI